ncbi:MAG: hypothetical protein LBD22_00010 [Spirochaetaceae bacterium]|jgi:hypothetical protein|nr:hypothetical protein [Spirochaetaceae bacterium]
MKYLQKELKEREKIMNLRAYTVQKLILGMIIGAALVTSSCSVDYNPSFQDFISESTNEEYRKGFFEYTITFPRLNGTEDKSYFTLVSQERDGDALLLDRGWINNAPKYTDDDIEYRRVASEKDAYKIPYGYYKLSLCIANPTSSVIVERLVWIHPGKTYQFAIALTPDDFI